ncbi:MAG: hypothetical protein IRY97_06025 [Thermomicrobiaceae bacterium]|nr:hypothetical protein [Thermomicrobiaceae bacterium]
MDVEPEALAGQTPLEPLDLVCLATIRSEGDLARLQEALERAGVPHWTQTITVREPGRESGRVYVLYVSASDEARANACVHPDHRGLPTLPLAHLRMTRLPRPTD